MSKIKICLDAGHVGSKYNQSPVVKTYYESAMVWALHLKLKAPLEARGFQVVTTGRASTPTSASISAAQHRRGATSSSLSTPTLAARRASTTPSSTGPTTI